jgi:hypothetical protein
MVGDVSLMYGTGLAGSLMYSSKPLSATGGSKESFPSAAKYIDRVFALFGGHSSYLRHWFEPVSKT